MDSSITTRWTELAKLIARVKNIPGNQRHTWINTEVSDNDLRHALQAVLRSLDAAEYRADESTSNKSPDDLYGCAQPSPRIFGDFRVIYMTRENSMCTTFRTSRTVRGVAEFADINMIRTGHTDPLKKYTIERTLRRLVRLRHPLLARVHAGGWVENEHSWIAQEPASGVPITQYCDQRRLRIHERLKLFVAVCDAVQATHRFLVLHRDIKPASVLIKSSGEVQVRDLGIAMLMDIQPLVAIGPVSRAAWLTPGYTSPEIRAGKSATTQSDVFSLGVLLHELVTGILPRWRYTCSVAAPSIILGAEGGHDALAFARRTSLPNLRHQLTGAIDAIVTTALNVEPTQRYPGVAEFAISVRHLLAGPIKRLFG